MICCAEEFVKHDTQSVSSNKSDDFLVDLSVLQTIEIKLHIITWQVSKRQKSCSQSIECSLGTDKIYSIKMLCMKWRMS